jgi:hypothetical protein
MSRSSAIWITFIFLVLFCGCSKTITTQQVVDKLNTKDELLKQLGKPDEKKSFPEVEEWTYYRDTVPPPDSASHHYIVTADSTKINSDSIKLVPVAQHNHYIKFIIDTNNKVVGHKNNGVDLSKKEKVGFGTSVLNVLGIILVLSIFIGYEIAKDKLGI